MSVWRRGIWRGRGAFGPGQLGFGRAEFFSNAAAIVPTDTRDGSVFFDGLDGSVSLVAAAPQGVPSGGLEVFAIARVKRQLVIRSAPFTGTLAGGKAELGETVLLDAVSTANFRYYGVVPPEKQPAWHDAWRDMPSLPAIVSLDLTFADGARMPSLLVRPRLAPTPYPKCGGMRRTSCQARRSHAPSDAPCGRPRCRPTPPQGGRTAAARRSCAVCA